MCSIGAGASQTFEIEFRPRKSHGYSDPLAVVSQYPGQAPVQIPFHAQGGFGRLAFDSPEFLGSVPVGQTLTTTFTVHNEATSCIAISRPTSGVDEIQFVGASPEFLELHQRAVAWPRAERGRAAGAPPPLLPF